MGTSINPQNYKMVKLDPPPEAMQRSGTASPMQEAVRASYDAKAWQSFLAVPGTPIMVIPASSGRPERKLSEADALAQEIQRAARQLGYSVKIRIVTPDGKPGLRNVFFLAGVRRTRIALTPDKGSDAPDA